MSLRPDQNEALRRFAPGEAVAAALTELLDRDRHLLEVDANERSITFRFAFYLQAHLPEWTVDCEYNRDGVEPKRLEYLGLYPDSEDDDAKTVYPDVIVHRRGSLENYLVIEFKKSTSRVDPAIDLAKLQGYKDQLGYEHALFVIVGTDDHADVARLEWI
ncbi:hypothetical protein [Pseudomonas sp. TCU-HL1]|uniref:hypothetical protein n=1 Tax=Pseudomonas sp. TCU-HL1 TaxID=1856685 RepID=UPI00083E1F13|nr:hypothetical protein [Pseudomonas sp. TCU-HL1]AOE85925.1 hypothetical protein THL1_3377 [Pseudomonas sp. TCU-HL1]